MAVVAPFVEEPVFNFGRNTSYRTQEIPRETQRKNTLNMEDLPSRVSRRSTFTLRRRTVGDSVRLSGGNWRRERRKALYWRAPENAWTSDEADKHENHSSRGCVPEGILEMIDLRAIPLPMIVRRQYKATLKARTSITISNWKAFTLTAIMGWHHFRTNLKEWLYSLEIWRGHLKDIEGQFGSGVVSYFVFLRWLLFLNLLIFLMEFGFVSLPTLIICSNAHEPPNTKANSSVNYSSCRNEFPSSATNESEKHFSAVVLDFFTGQGWLSNTVLFYSSYPSHSLISQKGVKYLLPLAYLLTGGAYFLVCLLLMVKSVSSGLREGYIDNDGVFNSFSNKVFSAWDYCICERNAAENKREIVAQDIESELQEEERLKRLRDRTTKEKCLLYGKRAFINLIIVPLLWYLSFVVIIEVILNKKVAQKGRNKFEEMLIRSGLALGITVPNLILPPLFEFLSFFEDWSPKFELGLNLWRRIFVKLPSIAVLMTLLYKDLDDRIKTSDALTSHCEQCWENEIAAQMYMLVWVDFIIVLFTSLGLETLRRLLHKRCSCIPKIGLAQFHISRNVIDLAYGQCLVLIGTFFSPILPLLAVFKLIVFYYAKKLSLFYNNRLPDKPFQNAKLNTIFTLLLLFTFFMCAGLVGYGVTRVPTSYCGPFKNTHCAESKVIIDELFIVVSTWPKLLQDLLHFTSTAAFVLPLLLLTVGLLFHYRSMVVAHRKLIDKLTDHLALEGIHKKMLLSHLESNEKTFPLHDITECNEDDRNM